MTADLIEAKQQLLESSSTCVLCKDGTLHHSTLPGVAPLLSWLQDGTDTSGSCAADKIVGKAAALLYCLLGVRQVYGTVVSLSAVKVLRKNGIEVFWDTLAENILNRNKSGLCPLEAATASIDDPEEALPTILQTIASLQK